MTFGLGVAAAMAAPLVMTCGFIAWDNHWKGSAFALNLYKCNLVTIGFLVLVCTTRSSNPFPANVFTYQAMGYMVLSSTIGILIGDWTWLQALQLLGARRVILMDSLKPFLAALMGWLILEEELRLAALGGIALTVSGVLIVSLETTNHDQEEQEVKEEGMQNDLDQEEMPDDTQGQQNDSNTMSAEDPENNLQAFEGEKADSTAELSRDESETGDKPIDETRQHKRNVARDLHRGYAYAILNVVLDTYGAVLIKQYGKAFTVWEINFLRFGFAGFVMLLISLGFTAVKVLGETKENQGHKETPWYALPMADMTRSSWGHVTVGVALVTFATPSLSNYALFEVALALALTLGSIGPLYSLPLSYLLQHDSPTLHTILGALLAVAGVVVLTWKGTVLGDE